MEAALFYSLDWKTSRGLQNDTTAEVRVLPSRKLLIAAAAVEPHAFWGSQLQREGAALCCQSLFKEPKLRWETDDSSRITNLPALQLVKLQKCHSLHPVRVASLTHFPASCVLEDWMLLCFLNTIPSLCLALKVGSLTCLLPWLWDSPWELLRRGLSSYLHTISKRENHEVKPLLKCTTKCTQGFLLITCLFWWSG